MLKIKDNIDLKGLEKYGFYKPRERQNFKTFVLYTNEYRRNRSHITIYSDGQIILIQEAYDYEYGLDLLYDMIIDGLVEKVSDLE